MWGLPFVPEHSEEVPQLYFDCAAGGCFDLVAVEKGGGDDEHCSHKKYTERQTRKSDLWLPQRKHSSHTKQADVQMHAYLVGLKSFSRKYEINVETMMDREVANPLRMLSAYLMTTATTKPPRACGHNNNDYII